MNTQTKTTLLFLIPFLSIILLFSGFVYFSVSNYVQEDFYKQLELRAITFAKVEIENETETNLPELSNLSEEVFEKLLHEQDYLFLSTPGKDFKLEAEALNLPISFFKEIVKKGEAEHVADNLFYKGIIYKGPVNEYVVIASAGNYFELHHSVYLKQVLFLVIAAGFIFSLFISLYLSKYIFKPIKKITERVKQISSENLHLRLDVRNSNDELNELTLTFNNMLDRIETSFETQNNFISNASHELRTPLTAIIGEADVILSKERTPEEYVEAMKIILDEAEKLDNKTKALLFLAQTGFDGKIQKFEKVRVDQLIWDVKETIEKINSKSNIHIDMSLLPENPAMLKVKGNMQLLHLAMSNIISNACKYSNYQVVNISLGSSDEYIFIVIKDRGIGIPEKELKYIYDPFFRASNTKNFEGYGIGLPLALNIIRMHNGEISVESLVSNGTTVQIKLPIGKF